MEGFLSMEEKQKRKKFSYAEKHSILEKTGYRCAHCGKSLDEHTLTIEHIFPVSKGGENNEFNLVALCEDCNFDKSNFTYISGKLYCQFSINIPTLFREHDYFQK